MTTGQHDDTGSGRKTFHFDRHTPDYRDRFTEITRELHSKCPVAWTETYGGHWVISGQREVFDIARRADVVSSDHDPDGVRRGYQGTGIPHISGMQSGFIEMDPPEQRLYRQALNPYLAPAAVTRWQPFVAEVTRAALDERIETGSIDFVDDLANIVPAVLTLAMLGLPLADWELYCEPTHALVYTPSTSPDYPRVMQMTFAMMDKLYVEVAGLRRQPRPGMIDALINADINGRSPDDKDIVQTLVLLIAGGFDTTTALTAHSLEYLGEHPDERERLSRERDTLLATATEEFLRFFTPSPGNGRTISADCEIDGNRFKEGDRIWLSWAMANRDPSVFPDPDVIDMERPGNRHASFGLGIHRCIGSNVARMVFKDMVSAVLDRAPDYAVDPRQTVHYETIGTIQGMRHLAASFTPGPRLGPGLAETLETLQRACDEQGLAEPATLRGRTGPKEP